MEPVLLGPSGLGLGLGLYNALSHWIATKTLFLQDLYINIIGTTFGHMCIKGTTYYTNSINPWAQALCSHFPDLFPCRGWVSGAAAALV